MPLGDGYTAEEQITGEAEHGGLQIITVTLMKWTPLNVISRKNSYKEQLCYRPEGVFYYMKADMGLSPGGKMKQVKYTKTHTKSTIGKLEQATVVLFSCNPTTWRSITGEAPPHKTPTAATYTKAGLPWFDYYDETQNGSECIHYSSKTKKCEATG